MLARSVAESAPLPACTTSVRKSCTAETALPSVDSASVIALRCTSSARCSLTTRDCRVTARSA